MVELLIIQAVLRKKCIASSLCVPQEKNHALATTKNEFQNVQYAIPVSSVNFKFVSGCNLILFFVMCRRHATPAPRGAGSVTVLCHLAPAPRGAGSVVLVIS